MTQITFKQQFTFEEEAVRGFAIHLGWKETLTRGVDIVNEDLIMTRFEIEEYPNPQSFTDYVDEKAREHTLLFTKSWAEELKNNYLNAQVEALKTTVEPTLYTQIVKPVENALTSEIVVV